MGEGWRGKSGRAQREGHAGNFNSRLERVKTDLDVNRD
jgi:hypothetical protein